MEVKNCEWCDTSPGWHKCSECGKEISEHTCEKYEGLCDECAYWEVNP